MGGPTLTQLDEMYMELKRRKNDVQRKEKETQELYRRYVTQYGGDEVRAQADFLKHTGMKNMPVVHEHTGTEEDIVRQTDLMLAKTGEKNDANDVGKLNNQWEENMFQDTGHALNSPPTMKFKRVDQGNHNISFLTPDAKAPGTSMTPMKQDFPSPSFLPKQGNSFCTPKEKINSSSTPTALSPDTALSPESIPSPPSLNSSVLNSSSHLEGTPGVDSSFVGNVMVRGHASGSEDGDSISIMSGLTSIDGATVAEAELRLTEFLRIETDNIKRMFSTQEASVEGDSHSGMVSTSESGTVVSAESRRVSEAAKKAEEMAKKMEEATAWMTDPTLLESDSESDNGAGEEETEAEAKSEWKAFWSEQHEREYYHNSNTNQTCWTKPRDVVINVTSLRKAKNKKGADDTVSVTFKEKELVEGETAVVKDYTKDTNSVASRDVGVTNDDIILQFRPDSDIHSVKSGSNMSKSSKVMQYRRKRARARKIRLQLLGGVAVVSCLAIGVHLTRKQMTLSAHREAEKYLAEQKSREVATERELIRQKKELKKERQRLEKMEEDRKAEEERRQAEIKRKAEEETTRFKEEERQAELKRKKEEEKRRAELKRKTEEERLLSELERKNQEEERLTVLQRKEEEEKRLAELKKKTDEETKRKEAQEAAEKERIRLEIEAQIREVEAQIREQEHIKAEKERQEQLRVAIQVKTETKLRPKACLIPLSYLFSRKCTEVATLNPFYDCQELTDAMME